MDTILHRVSRSFIKFKANCRFLAVCPGCRVFWLGSTDKNGRKNKIPSFFFFGFCSSSCSLAVYSWTDCPNWFRKQVGLSDLSGSFVIFPDFFWLLDSPLQVTSSCPWPLCRFQGTPRKRHARPWRARRNSVQRRLQEVTEKILKILKNS